MSQLTQRLVGVVPSARQLKWHELKFYSFIHFGMNTFYDSEWGYGTEDPARFNPTQLDTDQWVISLKKAGIKAVILTCKHHDGFCLWPSAYTEHSVKNSPYKEGQGDIVKELSESCKKYDLKFGVYLSPWDRHDTRYGDSEAYNDYFIDQLTELLTHYGELFSVWFDGACGEGPNGKKQVYDWKRYYEHIRKLQPEAAITICGPDVRWCGNEAGDCRESEWNVVPSRLAIPDYVAENSQQQDDEAFRERTVKHKDQDLGSREILKNEYDLIWYPAEVDTSIRPGWFYHKEEDEAVKPLEKLIDIYYHSVGGNATLLLNIPPDTRGLIHENDVKRLEEMGKYIEKTFSNDRITKAHITAESEEALHSIENIKVDDQSYFKTPDGVGSVNVTFAFDKAYPINHVVLEEQIALSQRIESFEVWVRENEEMKKVYTGTTVGSCRICKFDTVQTQQVILKILESRVAPTLKKVGIFTDSEI